MIARRRWPRLAWASSWNPAESGPLRRRSHVMPSRRGRSRGPTNPQIPHISVELIRGEEARRLDVRHFLLLHEEEEEHTPEKPVGPRETAQRHVEGAEHEELERCELHAFSSRAA